MCEIVHWKTNSYHGDTNLKSYYNYHNIYKIEYLHGYCFVFTLSLKKLLTRSAIYQVDVHDMHQLRGIQSAFSLL